MNKAYLFLLFILLVSCHSTNPKKGNSASINRDASYLALGDSYTIGEAVVEKETWPFLLAEGLGEPKPSVIAKTGWRTDELIQACKDQLAAKASYQLVSLLIGVNNQFQGKSLETCKQEFKQLLNIAIQQSLNGKKGVFVLSIPDYGCTPYGKNRAKEIGQAINRWNLAIESICIEENISFYNITDISRNGLNDPKLVASDGLHPSGKMYKLWIQEIIKDVKSQLNSF